MRFSGGGLPVLKTTPLFFAATMAGIDSTMLSLLKYMLTNNMAVAWILLPMIVYSIQPVLFYLSLQYETLTVMNLLWDVISDVIITCIGIFYFKEKIGPYKKLGVIFSLISIVLLSLDDGI
jgi:multidrug transporter EmrE-like cation transporter